MLSRDALGIVMIVVAAATVFGFGTMARFAPWQSSVAGRMLSGALFLLVVSALVRLTIYFIRWAERRWG